MALTEAEVREAAKVISRYDCEGVSDHEPNRHAAEALYVARAALIAAEKCREAEAIQNGRTLGGERLDGEARTQESRDRHEANIIAAHGELADPTCPNTAHKFSHCDCQPETGQPDDWLGHMNEHSGELVCPKCGVKDDAMRTTPCRPKSGRSELDYFQDGVKSERRRILPLIEGLPPARPANDWQEGFRAGIDAALSAVKGDTNE